MMHKTFKDPQVGGPYEPPGACGKHMKLVFYSGGATPANARLHTALAGLVGPRKSMSITYIPFASAGAQPFYQRFKRRYGPYGFTDFHYLAVDKPFTQDELKRALESDAIYLAGGNTFYFLHHLRRCGLLRQFRSYAAQGGVLAGLSAGAHILTPNIGLAGYPSDGADRNTVKLQNHGALDLVPFEFFPHYLPRKKLDEALTSYSQKLKHPIIAAGDGGGVIVEGTRMTFVGRAELFLAGAHARLSV